MSLTRLSNYSNLESIEDGDILLFKSTISKNSIPIILGTRSDWTHVGIAVWRDSPRKLFVLESTIKARGVGVRPFEALAPKYELIFIRKINILRDPGFQTTLQNFISTYEGKPYTSPVHIPLIPYIPFTDPGVSCGELVAKWLSEIGLLTPALKTKDFVNYVPSDFIPKNMTLESLFEPGPIKIVTASSVFESPTLLWLAVVVIITTTIFILISFNNIIA